jgi:hypothetical protein
MCKKRKVLKWRKGAQRPQTIIIKIDTLIGQVLVSDAIQAQAIERVVLDAVTRAIAIAQS